MDTPYYPHVVLGLNNRVCVVTLNILVVHGLYTCHQSGNACLVIKALAGFYHSKPPPPQPFHHQLIDEQATLLLHL